MQITIAHILMQPTDHLHTQKSSLINI